jgi:hypothetical protein
MTENNPHAGRQGPASLTDFPKIVFYIFLWRRKDAFLSKVSLFSLPGQLKVWKYNENVVNTFGFFVVVFFLTVLSVDFVAMRWSWSAWWEELDPHGAHPPRGAHLHRLRQPRQGPQPAPVVRKLEWLISKLVVLVPKILKPSSHGQLYQETKTIGFHLSAKTSNICAFGLI